MIGSGSIRRIRSGRLKTSRIGTMLTLVVVCIVVGGTGCGFTFSAPPPGAFLGRAGVYDYSPTVVQVGTVQQFWWCGAGGDTDTIQYASIDQSNHYTFGPITVMNQTDGGWDSVFVCNPKVVRGTFNNPLGDGKSYSYAMYYVGTSSPAGLSNNIGVAFSNDGLGWKKYPHPIIHSTTEVNYGVGQPAVYNSDQKAGIWLFYEDSNAPSGNQHIETKSTDGIHFNVVGKLTRNGLNADAPDASWGDMAYDTAAGYWYAAFNLPLRNPATVGNVTERGQLGVALYRIPNDSLLSGVSPWQQLKLFDTNATGNESTFLAGFLRDQYGTVNIGQYPAIQLYTSISNPRPAWDATATEAGKSDDTATWDIGTATWTPGSPLIPLNRYVNASTHQVTTGWIDPLGGFKLESILGHLYESPQQGAAVPFYGCKAAARDYFVSTDINCEGKLFLGTNGFGYSQPVPGLALLPLYSCSTGHDHFVSKDANCEGQQAAKLLGYVVP